MQAEGVGSSGGGRGEEGADLKREGRCDLCSVNAGNGVGNGSR